MPKPLREGDPSYQETTQVYQSYVEEIMLALGWPSGWPNVETPPASEWWRETKAIPPDLPKRARLRPPNAKLFEISGLPQSGKSSSEAGALGKIRKIAGGWEIHDWPELVHSAGPNAGILMGTDIDSLPFEKFDGDDWYWALNIQLLKEYYLRSRIKSFDLETSDPRLQLASLAYRGPVDAVIWYYALASHKTEGSPFVIPAGRRKLLDKHLPFLAGFATMMKRLEAVVLIGIDQGEAQKRRATAGKTAPGWITDSPIYQDLSAWSDHFIKKVWPRLYDQHGTGLLVLNGEDPLKENVQKITDYVSAALI